MSATAFLMSNGEDSVGIGMGIMYDLSFRAVAEIESVSLRVLFAVWKAGHGGNLLRVFWSLSVVLICGTDIISSTEKAGKEDWGRVGFFALLVFLVMAGRGSDVAGLEVRDFLTEEVSSCTTKRASNMCHLLRTSGVHQHWKSVMDKGVIVGSGQGIARVNGLGGCWVVIVYRNPICSSISQQCLHLILGIVVGRH